mmetsp:Transcript_25513/g.79588  ORF Transcript_25513/g.79588 Transcript_25513/m.79588 type:complete len:346 (+) Transcript_25513:131-1168(+)
MICRLLVRRGIVACLAVSPASTMAQHYRADGVRITHDPYAKGMAEKYGAPGKTDSEGFDPYADSVGPGIYGGTVERDARGQIVIGRQYQNHNPRPGPVYSGGGYTPTTQKLKDPEALRAWLAKHPDLVNEISTGGATPLHNCGMSARNQAQAAVLVENGADVEAVDTYGYTPLHRMASNNLAIGAELLLAAGADPQFVGGSGETAYAVARSSRARDVLKVLDAHGSKRSPVDVTRIVVEGGGDASVNGEYVATPASKIPAGFDAVCKAQDWDTSTTWTRLNAGKTWYSAPNEAYIYHNSLDGLWWIDSPDGNGAYKGPGPAHAPPAHGYQDLGEWPAPTVLSYRG